MVVYINMYTEKIHFYLHTAGILSSLYQLVSTRSNVYF